MHSKLRPHSGDPKILAQSAEIYSRGRTPEVTNDGVKELNVKPGGPDLAAKHLREIHRSFGESGVLDTIYGLQTTRGNQFVHQMLSRDSSVTNLVASAPPNQSSLPKAVHTALNANDTGRPLPPEQSERFARATGHDVSGVRLFDDHHSYEAASAVSARAFTVGQRVFFNRGQYEPGRESGSELLMHELVHTVQQKGAGIVDPTKLQVSKPNDTHERQAESAAEEISRRPKGVTASDGEETDDQVLGGDKLQVNATPASLQRAITFTTVGHDPATNNVAANEEAGGFRLTSADPTFQWQPDVTIHGDAGDPFAEWETAHHQVVKGFWENIWWGVGANRTHRQGTIPGLPLRDATGAGNTWYSDWRAQHFAANGDVGSPVMHDRPQTALIPWNNPVAGRAGNSGSFNHGVGFVSTLSARHIPDGTGAAAFRHLNHMHWNFTLDGTFDAGLAAGARVALTGGALNHSKMFSGADPNNMPLPGGNRAIDALAFANQ